MMSRIVTTGGTERCTLSKNFFLPLARPMRPAGLSISSGSATSSSSGAMSSCSTWPSSTLLSGEDLRTALTCPLLPCGPHRGHIPLALRQLRSLPLGRKHPSHISFFQVDGPSSSLAVPLWCGAHWVPRAPMPRGVCDGLRLPCGEALAHWPLLDSNRMGAYTAMFAGRVLVLLSISLLLLLLTPATEGVELFMRLGVCVSFWLPYEFPGSVRLGARHGSSLVPSGFVPQWLVECA